MAALKDASLGENSSNRAREQVSKAPPYGDGDDRASRMRLTRSIMRRSTCGESPTDRNRVARLSAQVAKIKDKSNDSSSYMLTQRLILLATAMVAVDPTARWRC
jgi:hypothetical protein